MTRGNPYDKTNRSTHCYSELRDLGGGATPSRSPSASDGSTSSANDCPSAGNYTDIASSYARCRAGGESDDDASNQHNWAPDADHD